MIARPSGCTSTSLPVKSVSRTEEAKNSRNSIGPTASRGRSRTGVLYTSTSSRSSTERRSRAPSACAPGRMTCPPIVGTGRHGVVQNYVGRLFTGCFHRERAVAMQVVRVSSAVQVIRAVVCVGNRPIGLRAPALDSHHKQENRWLFLNIVVLVPQPPVEPTQADAGQVERTAAGGRTELALRKTAREVGVAPQSDDQPLILASTFGSSVLPYAGVVLKGIR